MGFFTFIRSKNRGVETGSINLNDAAPDFVDGDKLRGLKAGIVTGIRNHALLQKFSSFRWPYWICCSLNGDSTSFGGTSTPVLINHSHRDWIYYTNFLSRDALLIDPVGMISPSYDVWSLEIWAVLDSRVYRPQERTEKVIQSRDIRTSLLTTIWKEKDFQIRQTVFGAKSSIDEAVLEIECTLSRKTESAHLLIVVRPYNPLVIGGISGIEFRKDTGVIRINGSDRIVLGARPDFVNAGSSTTGDVETLPLGKDTVKSSCRYGMAALVFGYALTKGGQSTTARISLNGGLNIGPSKIEVSRLKNEYSDFAAIRIKNGMNLSFTDARMQKWAYGAKAAMLNFLYRGMRGGQGELTIRQGSELYYVAAACNRMGFFSESGKILNAFLNELPSDTSRSFEKLIVSAYSLSAIADYFIHSRDMEFLQNQYSRIRDISAALLRGCSTFKSLNTGVLRGKNSLEHCLDGKSHVHDAVLVSFSMRQFAYLARCMGLFGDEIKFGKESDRIDRMILREMEPVLREFAPGNERPPMQQGMEKNEFHSYDIFAGYPFKLQALTRGNLKSLISWIDTMFTAVPLHFKSLGGWDTLSSVMFAVNLLQCGDARCYEILDKLMDTGGERFALPDVINPRTGMGVMGAGDSPVAVSALFSLMRNALFMDFEQRLDILPLPRQEWFVPGSEISIQDAPSRFGPINIKITSSANEVQFRFTDIPKFVPPEIALNLPFKARIREENDFVLKKESKNTFIINGWPSVVRFIK